MKRVLSFFVCLIFCFSLCASSVNQIQRAKANPIAIVSEEVGIIIFTVLASLGITITQYDNDQSALEYIWNSIPPEDQIMLTAAAVSTSIANGIVQFSKEQFERLKQWAISFFTGSNGTKVWLGEDGLLHFTGQSADESNLNSVFELNQLNYIGPVFNAKIDFDYSYNFNNCLVEINNNSTDYILQTTLYPDSYDLSKSILYIQDYSYLTTKPSFFKFAYPVIKDYADGKFGLFLPYTSHTNSDFNYGNIFVLNKSTSCYPFGYGKDGVRLTISGTTLKWNTNPLSNFEAYTSPVKSIFNFLYDFLDFYNEFSYIVDDSYLTGENALFPAEGETVQISIPQTLPQAIAQNPSQVVSQVGTETIANELNPEVQNPNTDLDLDGFKFGQALMNKFPFCLPFDLYNSIKSMSAPAKCPKWIIPFNVPALGVSQDLVLDMQPFEKLAMVLRWFLSVMFLWGLILVTKSIIS